MTGKEFKIIGIDYSLTSPGICFFEGTDFSFQNCNFAGISSKKKFADGVFWNDQIQLFSYPPYDADNQIERFDKISEMFIGMIEKFDPDFVCIEGLSMGSKSGKILDIAENAGIMKYKLYKSGYTVYKVPPTTIKKFATGKGNSKKEAIYDCFLEETGQDMQKFFAPKAKKIGNPVSDIVDSYYIAKYGFNFLRS